MKLTEFSTFGPFVNLRNAMGISREGSFSLVVPAGISLTAAELDAIETSGIEIDSLDEIRTLEDGTLAYKGRRVVVYIRDVSQYGGRHKKIDLPRFHVSGCNTLDEMKKKKKFEKYVAASRDDGRFELRFIDKKFRNYTGRIEALSVCQNCMNNLSYNGFHYGLAKSERITKVRAFKLKDFFEKYPKSLIAETPKHNAKTAPTNTYNSDFDVKARQLKSSIGWKCQACGIDLSDEAHRRFLQVHHVNGLKYDDSTENLRALCMRCHADQPDHGHIKQLPEYRIFMVISRHL